MCWSTTGIERSKVVKSYLYLPQRKIVDEHLQACDEIGFPADQELYNSSRRTEDLGRQLVEQGGVAGRKGSDQSS